MKTPMQKLGIALALSLSPSLVTQAQFNLGFELYNDIKVVQNNDTLAHPWVGGLNNPQFSSIDIDLDGHHDIVAYERDGEVYRVFIWEEGVSYRSDFTSHKALPKVRGSFALFRDYNEDGKQDLFSVGYNNQGINVHLNTSESEVSFTQMTENLRFRHPGSGYLYSYFPANDLPGIADFNGDGDLDIIVQGQTGVLDYPALLYFENQSQELYGHSDSLAYELVNPCWGKIREFVNDAGWTEYICDTNRSGNRGSRHGGTTLTPIDLNGDGAMDLLTGDAYSGNMQSLINTSTSVDAVVDLSLSDSTYPSYDDPIFVPTLPAAFFEDIDHDGEKDLIAAPNQLTAIATFYLDTSINTNVDWYYKNVGTTAHPDFKLQEKGFFSGKMIDVGSKSMPALADINGDGLLDLLVGNEGFTAYGGSAAASLTLYLNVGDIENPVFELVDKDFLDISEFGFGFVHPALADLDGDGDYDLLIGEDQGMLHYFKNRGTPEIHDFHLTEPEFANIDVDLSAHPQFFDVNLDGAPDLLVGDYYGRIQYFENAGTPSEPDFSKNPTVEKVGDLLTFHAHGGESTPMLTRKLDSLGSNLYLLQSNADGVILVYGPITDLNSLGSPMQVQDSIVVNATFTSLTGGNLFGDFRHELVIGQRTGGLFTMKRIKDIPLSAGQEDMPSTELEWYPNPTNGTVELKPFAGLSFEPLQLQVFDVSGSLVMKKKASPTKQKGITLDLGALPNGVYTISLKNNEHSSWSRIVKQ